MITKQARNDLANSIKTDYGYYNIGSGGDSTNPNATELDAPLGSRVAVTGTLSGESAIEWKFTVQGSSYIGNTIREVGIFNASSGGDMLVRVNYDAIGPLTSTDEIEFVIVVEVD